MPVLNVVLSEEVYQELVLMKTECRKTWSEFLEAIASGEIDVNLAVLDVDGESPDGHKVTIQLGDYVYRWDGNDIVTVKTPVKQKLVRSVLFALLASAPG